MCACRTTAGIAGALMALLTGTSSAQQPAALMLNATTDARDYALGEPVYLTVMLRNASQRPESVPAQITTKDGTLQITIKDDKGVERQFVPTSVLDSDAPEQQLAPGAVKASVEAIFYGGRGWTFDRPGRYEIKATFTRPQLQKSPPVRAEPLMIEVRNDPAGRLLVDNSSRPSLEAGKFLVWMAGDHLRGGTSLLEQVVKSQPGSPAANAAALALGRSYARHFQDYGAETVRAPDYARAQGYLERVKPADLPAVSRVQYHLARALAEAGQGRREPAVEQVRQAQELIGKNPALANLAEVVERTRRTVDVLSAPRPAAT